MMPSKLTRGLLIFALLVFAVVSWQWTDDRDETPQAENATIEMAETQSDYYLENFQIINVSGSADDARNTQNNLDQQARHLKITGQTLSHHYIEGYSVITNPTVQLRTADNSEWLASASNGRVSANFDVLDLQGNVQLSHNPESGPQSGPEFGKERENSQSGLREITVETNSLSINTGNRTISSDESVQVNGAGWQYNANTMRAEIDQGTLSFTSGVEAQFASPSKR